MRDNVLLLSWVCCIAVAAEPPLPVDGDKRLELVQIIWRHGDRSPTTTCPTDSIQEGNWTFGGGGWGQLSPLGMKQHVQLGTKLRKRYVNSKYLSERYRANEVYVRSTDVNRTLISALSNLIGMYGQGSAQAGTWGDIPDLSKENYHWPTGYVPIPIHTIDDDYDYWGNPDMICPRQSALWDLAQTSDAIQATLALNNTQDILSALKTNCQETYDLASLWKVIDAFFIERLYNLKNPAFVTEDLYKRTTVLNDLAQDYVNGIGLTKTSGIDLSTEIKRIRGGSMINLMYDHIVKKSGCLNGTECSKWMGGLKYFVYSAHDTTVYAYLTALNAEKAAVKPEGYPHYSAAVITEYWRDSKKNDYVKFVYHTGFNDDFMVITSSVQGCEAYPVYCPLEKFQAIANTLSSAKWGSPAQMCADTDITGSKLSSRFGPTAAIVFAIWKMITAF